MPKAGTLAIEKRLTFLNDQRLPAMIVAGTGESLAELLSEEKESLLKVKHKYGAILFRGFSLGTAEEFRRLIAGYFAGGMRSYLGGTSPRGEVTAGVYESTRFPPNLRLPQHNEMSYLPNPPREIAFFCEVAPRHGGETPLADSRVIYRQIPSELCELFEKRGICYHRYLYGPQWNRLSYALNRFVELHTSWMAAFSTDDRMKVMQVCVSQGVSTHWDDEEGVRISNVLPSVRQHPVTGETVWFNQAPTFLVTRRSVGWIRWALYQIAYPQVLRRPFHATFGTGESITSAHLDAVQQTIEDATACFPWQRGDLLLVDNYLVSHGRMPFRGERRILVSMR